jgi:hypothetical protein
MGLFRLGAPGGSAFLLQVLGSFGIVAGLDQLLGHSILHLPGKGKRSEAVFRGNDALPTHGSALPGF